MKTIYKDSCYTFKSYKNKLEIIYRDPVHSSFERLSKVTVKYDPKENQFSVLDIKRA